MDSGSIEWKSCQNKLVVTKPACLVNDRGEQLRSDALPTRITRHLDRKICHVPIRGTRIERVNGRPANNLGAMLRHEYWIAPSTATEPVPALILGSQLGFQRGNPIADPLVGDPRDSRNIRLRGVPNGQR